MRIGYIVLAHDQPEAALRLIRRLTADDRDLVCVHWDAKSALDFDKFSAGHLDDAEAARVLFCPRVPVTWGGWTMVEATLLALETLAAQGVALDYVYLISGADYPIKPLARLKDFLARQNGREFIECVDATRERWVVDGLSQERYLYHHWFNWRTHPRLFDLQWKLQRLLGLKRRLPNELRPHFGSQWWTLTWKTALKVLELARNPRVSGFFKTVWVPDEIFFQTLVASVASSGNIAGHPLTLYQFSEAGAPICYYDDHIDYLLKQPFFFARKLSPYAEALRDGLDAADVDVRPEGDAAIGRRTRAYADFIATSRDGIAGRRVMGHVPDPWYGDLHWNDKRYFVLLGRDEAALARLRQRINRLDGFRCLGEIFHPDRIDTGHDDWTIDGFGPASLSLRDMAKTNFIVESIHQWPDDLVGFVLPIEQDAQIEAIVSWDRNALVVVVHGDGRHPPARSARLGESGHRLAALLDTAPMPTLDDYLARLHKDDRYGRTFVPMVDADAISDDDLRALLRGPSHLRPRLWPAIAAPGIVEA